MNVESLMQMPDTGCQKIFFYLVSGIRHLVSFLKKASL